MLCPGESLTTYIPATSLSEDKAGAFLPPTVSILTLLGRATANLSNAFLVDDFAPRMSKIWASVKKIAAARKSDKVRQSILWLNEY